MNHQEWYTAKSLAGLPGMPETKSAVIRRAHKESWQSRPRQGRGGGMEYHLNSLPKETRHALALQQIRFAEDDPIAKIARQEETKRAISEAITQAVEQQNRQRGAAIAARLYGDAAKRMDAKLAIIHALNDYRAQAGLPPQDATLSFVVAYNNNTGQLPLEDWVRELRPTVSVTSLQRWSKTLRQRGIHRLAGDYGNRKGASKIDRQPELQRVILAMLVDHPHVGASHIMQGAKARLKDRADIEWPSKRGLQRWIADWKRDNGEVHTALSNPDAWKNKYMTAFGSASEGIIALNQRWEFDSTPADILLKDGRHSLIGVIDVYSRRAKLHVSKTSKAAAVAHVTRVALIDWGVPEIAKTDNGQDYISHHMRRVYTSLGVQQQTSAPFSPWEKPHIERFFRTFAHDLVELLPNYIGHNVADRQAIEARKAFAERLFRKGETVEIAMETAQFQQFCDAWVETKYAHAPHEGLKGKTPFEVASAWRGEIRKIEDPTVLDLLLSEAPGGHGWRTVTKKGLRIDNDNYIAPELEAYVGQQVRVLYDPEDLGRVYVFGGDKLDYVCIAECPERTGISRQEVAVKARELQKARVQEAKRELKKIARKENTQEIVFEILEERERAASKLTPFPQRSTPVETAAISAALDALQGAAQGEVLPPNNVIDPDELARRRARQAEEDNKPVAPLFESPFKRALWISEQALERDLTAEELEYLTRFRRENPKSAKAIDELIEGRLHGVEIGNKKPR